MTIDEAIRRLQELKHEAGGGTFLEVRQLNGVQRSVDSILLERTELPQRECVLIVLQDEPVHG